MMSRRRLVIYSDDIASPAACAGASCAWNPAMCDQFVSAAVAASAWQAMMAAAVLVQQ